MTQPHLAGIKHDPTKTDSTNYDAIKYDSTKYGHIWLVSNITSYSLDGLGDPDGGRVEGQRWIDGHDGHDW